MSKTPKSIRRTQLTPEQVAQRAERLVSGGVKLTKAERVKRAKTDFQFFCSYYLAPYFGAEPASFHREVIEMMMMHDRGAFAAPREHAKSTNVSFAFPLHQICIGARHFIVIFRESDGIAQQNVDDIRQELEENELIREDFSDLVGSRKWAGAEFVTSNKVKVLGRGRGSAARGLRYKQWRPDLVILDDIEDDELVESKERRDKLERWLKRVVSNIVAPNGKLFVIGTILHHDSVLTRLLKITDVYFTRIWRAILEDGKPLWPARWPLARLEAKKKEIGTRDFNTEFMNNPANEDDQIFPPSGWKFFRDEDVAGKIDVAGAIDPAIGQKAKNDDTGIGVVGSRGGNYYILSVLLKKLKIQQQVEAVITTCRQWPGMFRFAVETVAYQSALKQLLDEASQRDHLQLPIVAAEDLSSDKLKRISTLAPLVEQGLVYWPSASSSYWTPDIQKCMEQFEALGCSTDSHDDGPDCIERAIRLFRGRSGRKGKVSLL
ncbi:MAG TPA: hypothetical protein VHC90_11450 [Bryobacteraceae bacterium]|nr:hypothetical protein [Bryobacteraceae bacterium]